MDERQRFKKAFRTLHTSNDFEERMEEKMNNRKNSRFKPAIAAAAAVAVLLVGGTTAYASDLGGIQRTVQIWLHGDLTEATFTYNKENNDGEFNADQDTGTYTLTDKNGNVIQSGGGVSGNGDGTTRPATADELMEDLNSPVTDFTGEKKLLYYKDQVIDLSDRFSDSDYYYMTIKDGSKTGYLTIKSDGGLAYSEDRYILPDEFDTAK